MERRIPRGEHQGAGEGNLDEEIVIRALQGETLQKTNIRVGKRIVKKFREETRPLKGLHQKKVEGHRDKTIKKWNMKREM